jgi:hypothetical protein
MIPTIKFEPKHLRIEGTSLRTQDVKQSGWIVCLETLELIYMSPLRARQKTTLPLTLKL